MILIQASRQHKLGLQSRLFVWSDLHRLGIHEDGSHSLCGGSFTDENESQSDFDSHFHLHQQKQIKIFDKIENEECSLPSTYPAHAAVQGCLFTSCEKKSPTIPFTTAHIYASSMHKKRKIILDFVCFVLTGHIENRCSTNA